MRKRMVDEFVTKSAKREEKKRPRMKMHGAALRKASPHAGKKLTH